MYTCYNNYSVVSTGIQESDSSLIQVTAAKAEVWQKKIYLTINFL